MPVLQNLISIPAAPSGYKGRKQSTLTVQLDPDVATIFPDSGAVSEGLRLLMRLIKHSPSQPIVQSVTASKEV
ncbi:MAG: hypothetical protein EAZ09_16455 [Oscillatoriales cyanobacterium]|nr:MAG: hypothetical protein EAZ18_15470 [Oscillatoriales cyanobacterium]TAH19418.1 MAG: hypothetical protein EAZ09_16455 [Oscillatoriales cyanobacterium]